MVSELIKLVSILSGTVVVLVGGFIFQKKMQTKKKEANTQEQRGDNNSDNMNTQTSMMSSDNSEEEKAKEYINTYKSQYSKDSLKSGLIGTGISDSNADMYLNKYF